MSSIILNHLSCLIKMGMTWSTWEMHVLVAACFASKELACKSWSANSTIPWSIMLKLLIRNTSNLLWSIPSGVWTSHIVFHQISSWPDHLQGTLHLTWRGWNQRIRLCTIGLRMPWIDKSQLLLLLLDHFANGSLGVLMLSTLAWKTSVAVSSGLLTINGFPSSRRTQRKIQSSGSQVGYHKSRF